MSDGLVLHIQPPDHVREQLRDLRAYWSIDDHDGESLTAKHKRARIVNTPVTGAGCRITCYPENIEKSDKLSWEISFYAAASLVGNNVFQDNLVRLPAEAALQIWRWYMWRTYGGRGVTAELLSQVTLEHCHIKQVTMVYLFDCGTPDVSADVKLTRCAEVKLTHLGDDDGLLAVDVDPGASSGDTCDGPQGRGNQGDREAAGLLAQHRAAVLA